MADAEADKSGRAAQRAPVRQRNARPGPRRPQATGPAEMRPTVKAETTFGSKGARVC